MKKVKSISRKISQVYMVGAAFLLFFYGLAFYLAILNTEHINSFRRIAVVAPFHFQQFKEGNTQHVKIDPLLTIYNGYEYLPDKIKQKITYDWIGKRNFHFDDDSEFSVYSQYLETNESRHIVYAVENIKIVEWNDLNYALMEVVLFISGMILFLIAAGFIVKTASRIAAPFKDMATRLDNDSTSNFEKLEINGEQSLELVQAISALNSYRGKIQRLIDREKSFTRYISHELRTPMSVIKGRLSLLKRSDDEAVGRQVKKMGLAVNNMEQLTHTFLLLARDKTTKSTPILINRNSIDEIVCQFEPKMRANEVAFELVFSQDFELKAEQVLVSTVIQNLLSNAINCTIGGKVILSVSPNAIKVIDNGVGLDSKPRGYEGFGVGLQLVNDICNKYKWQFTITNNPESGCTASISF